MNSDCPKIFKLSINFSLIGILGTAAFAPNGASAATFYEALSGGKVSANIRYRDEWVEQQNIGNWAHASTVRTHLGYLTGDYLGLGGFLQFEDIHTVAADRYNDTINGATSFPIIADPVDTEINQAYLSYKAYKTLLKYGRQTLIYDNHRFIGNVGWRQNEQSFDAFSAVNTSIPATTLSYAYTTNINRIFSDRSDKGNVRLKGHLFNAAYKGLTAGGLTGYAYLLDYNPKQALAATASNMTFGLRFDGNAKVADLKYLYTLEYATQSDYGDGASTVDADYQFLMAGVDWGFVQLKLNYEKLAGDGKYGFATPLATLHAFNGWADQFLITPTRGIVDQFISVGGTVAGINLLARYHDFSSDEQGYAYGNEIDLQAAKKITDYMTLLLKYADYRGDNNSRNIAPLTLDVTKMWLQMEIQF